MPLDSIIEFKFHKNRFIPDRIRDDKVKPNYIGVAQNIWDNIHNPVTAEDLFRGASWTIIRKEQPEVVTAERVCNFLKLLGKKPYPRIFDGLTAYLGSDTITEEFRIATERAIELGVKNDLVKILQKYFDISTPR